MDPRFVTPMNKQMVVESAKSTADAGDGQTGRYGNEFIDYLSALKEFNRRIPKDRKVLGTLPFLTLTTPVVELFLNVCSSFRQPLEVKYIALEIFDRFINQHFIDLWEYASNQSKDPDTQKRFWRRISSRAQKQALLRMVSSIQIASKFVLQSSSLTLKHVQAFLTKCGQPYNLNSIYLSELRLFSSIGCKVPMFSVFDYTRAFLESLQYWRDVDQLYPTCEKVLEFTYLQREEIYMRFFWMGTNRWVHSRQQRLQLADMELDNFLLAASVVVSSLLIHNLEGLDPETASEILSKLVDISSNDVRAMASIIAQMILGRRAVALRS